MKIHDPIIKLIQACALATSLAIGQAPSDSLVAASPAQEQPADTLANRADTVPLAPPSAPLPTDAVVVQHTAARPRTRNVTLLIDFADVNAQYKTNQRHFRSNSQRANYCCVDVAWQPLSLAEEHFWLGPVMNFGGWIQTFDQGPAVMFNDLYMGSSLSARLDPRNSGPWVRADVGFSLLTISRRTTGTDYGYGAALRAGWLFSIGRLDWIVGMGTDMRSYENLDMKPITAATLFAGVGL